MGGQTAFGYLVHALRTDLHLHPFVLRTEYGDMQTLIAVALGHRKPIAQPLRVTLVHIGDDSEDLPAHRHFLCSCGMISNGWLQNDPDGEQVVDTLKTAFLLFHLLPDAVDTLRTTLHVIGQTGLAKLLIDRLDELLDVGVTTLLRGIQLLLDQVIGIMLQVFQGEVLQFAFQLVQT